MAANYDAIDVTFSWNGDFLVGRDGDFADTSSDQIQSLIQEIQDVSASSLSDWLEHPTRAASIEEFVGEPNSRETGQQIKDRIFSALVVNGIVQARDLEVRVVPIGIYTVMVIVRVTAQASVSNSLQTNSVVVTLAFDYKERGIYFASDTGD